MTSHELARGLLAGPDRDIELAIADPTDTATTRADIVLETYCDCIQIRGFVWSDDDTSYAPWNGNEEEDDEDEDE